MKKTVLRARPGAGGAASPVSSRVQIVPDGAVRNVEGEGHLALTAKGSWSTVDASAEAPVGLHSPGPRGLLGPADWWSPRPGVQGSVAQTVAYKRKALQVGEIVMVPHPLSGEPILKRIARIEPGGLFLTGDNAAQSMDSRSWGLISPEAVQGRVTSIYKRA